MSFYLFLFCFWFLFLFSFYFALLSLLHNFLILFYSDSNWRCGWLGEESWYTEKEEQEVFSEDAQHSQSQHRQRLQLRRQQQPHQLWPVRARNTRSRPWQQCQWLAGCHCWDRYNLNRSIYVTKPCKWHVVIDFEHCKTYLSLSHASDMWWLTEHCKTYCAWQPT